MPEAKLICSNCKNEYSLNTSLYRCGECSSPLTVDYEYENTIGSVGKSTFQERPRNIARYREFLPTDDRMISLGEGWTPITTSNYYSKNTGAEVKFKLEYLNPTGSFKDRGTAVMLSKLLELGRDSFVDDSSGNAGSSLAAYCAHAGVDCTIYTPARASGPKVRQIQMYGADLRKIEGGRARVAKVAEKEANNGNHYYASHNLNPFFLEGMKTLAYEVAEQYEWHPPENILFPVGGGALLIGTHRGFKELSEIDLIDRIPSLYAIQSEACQPVVKAFKSGQTSLQPVDPKHTVAEGIHIGIPHRGKEIISALRDSNGGAASVTEKEIVDHFSTLPRKEGVYAEPTSAVSFAGLTTLKEEGHIRTGEEVLIPVTGFGLKEANLAREVVGSPQQK